jgi:ribonuclease P protein component
MKFSRQSRLLKPAEFKLVFQQAVRSRDDSFRVLARVNNKNHHRLGMAISKKACTQAVGRNRIKRLVRESFRLQIASISQENALDFVVMPTNLTSDQSNATLHQSISAHWQRLIKKAGNRLTETQQDQIRTQI